MQCLPRLSVPSWLHRANLAGADFESGRHGTLVRRECGSLFQLAAARSAAAARAMVAWLHATEPRASLVVVTEHGVWPSSENLSLYYAWRRALSVLSTLEDAPAHEFLPFEKDEMVSLVQMALIFGWSVLAVAGDGTAAFSFDDDGTVVAFADSGERAARLASWIAATGGSTRKS